MRLRSSSGVLLEGEQRLALEPVHASAAGAVDSSGRTPGTRTCGSSREHVARRARRAWPRAGSRVPRAGARRSPWRSRSCRWPGPCAGAAANSMSSCCRSASTADCMSGYCSLQASARPSCAVARCTWPSEAAAAERSSKEAKRALPVGAELGHHAALDEGRAHRRRLALQLAAAPRRIRAAARRGWSPGAARPSSSGP